MSRRLTHGPALARSQWAWPVLCWTEGELFPLPQLERDEIVLDAESVEDLDRHDLVASARHVHPIGVPEPRIAVCAHAPEVDQSCAVLVGDVAHQLVVDRESTAQGCEHGNTARVVRREHHEVSAGFSQTTERLVVLVDQHVEVDARTQHVVGAGVDADQVGVQHEGRLNLLIEDREQLATPNREVGVREVLGHVRPAPRPYDRPSHGRRWAAPRRGRQHLR